MNVYFSNSQETFSYSDGDVVENKLLEVISSANDLTIGSPELQKNIQDWPTRYHLSPQRVDLMRPLEEMLKGDILEIGSGCGAITRYLGELGHFVTALEGSPKRAQITASRCRDLENVKVYCDNFDHFELDQKFDVITLIGVLEYAPLFIDGTSPQQEMLKKVRSFLKPDGILIIAIENQLGLKYFAGAPEDHLNIPFAGIENKYTQKSAITFGKTELGNITRNAGFGKVEFLYPFPDYKLPSAVITEHGATDTVLNLSDILKFHTDHLHNGEVARTFNVEQALPSIIKNNLIEDLSNSFLLVASVREQQQIDSGTLAFTFSTQRKKEFCKLNKIVKTNSVYTVTRQKVYDIKKQSSDTIKHRIIDEKYIQGVSYINKLENILKKSGWKIDEVVEWATPWFLFLKSKSVADQNSANDYKIPGEFLDAIPQNFIVDHAGNSIPFDQEWISTKSLNLSYVLFRGLVNSFNHYKCAAPNENFSVRMGDLSLMVVSKLLPNTKIDIQSIIQSENEFLNVALGIDKLFDILYVKSIAQENVQNKFNIEPINEFMTQVFWASSDAAFFEERSFIQKVILNGETKKLIFPFPSIETAIEYLRFDITDKVGLINIRSIQIKTKDEQPVWSFNVRNIHHRNNTILIHTPEFFPEKILQLSITCDPYFIVHIPEILVGHDLTNLIIEIELSPIDAVQFAQLNGLVNRPLSYASEADSIHLVNMVNDLKGQIERQAEQLQMETAHLKQELVASNNQLEKERVLISELNTDKSVLINELNLKNELISSVNAEKANFQTTISGKNSQIAQAEELKNNLQQQVTAQETTIANLLNEKKIIEQQKNHFQELNEISTKRILEIESTIQDYKKNTDVLLSDKKHLETIQVQQQKNIDEIVSQNATLSTLVMQQQAQVGDLNKEFKRLQDAKEQLNKQKDLVTSNLDEKNQENKLMSEKINELNERIDFFINNYENKNIIQIAVNQLKRKKR